MAYQGSTGNVIAALCSFFIPGLGQLIQGRLLMAIVHFVLAFILWFLLLGWVIHLWSILDAALFKTRSNVVQFGEVQCEFESVPSPVESSDPTATVETPIEIIQGVTKPSSISFGSKLATFSKSVGEKGMQGAQFALLKTKIAKLRQLDLKHAHYGLGKRCYELKVQPELFAAQYEKIAIIETRIKSLRNEIQANEGADFYKKLQAGAANIQNKATSKALSVKLMVLFVTVGRIAASKSSDGEPGEELQIIRGLEARIQQLNAECAAVHQPKLQETERQNRLLITAGAVIIVLSLFATGAVLLRVFSEGENLPAGQNVSLTRYEKRAVKALETIEIKTAENVDEQLFLLMVLENLYERWPIIDPKAPKPSMEQLATLRMKANRYASYIASEKFDPILKIVFQDFIETIDAHEVFWNDVAGINKQTSSESIKFSGESIATGAVGGWAVAKAFDNNDGSFNGNAVAVGAVVGILKSLWDTIEAGNQLDEAKQRAIQSAWKRFSDKMSTAQQAAQQAANDLSIRNHWQRVEAGFAISTEKASRVTQLREQKDWNGLLSVYQSSLKVKPRDPFVLMYVINLEEFLSKGTADAEKYLDWARKYIEAASLVPKPLIYDGIRHDLLSWAGGMALMAAKKQTGSQGLGAAPVDAGRLAVVYWKTLLKLDPMDAEGFIRAKLGEALAYAGKKEAGEKCLLEVKDLCKAYPRYHYTLARIQSSLAETSEALVSLNAAISGGYANIIEARTDPDFQNLRTNRAIETEDLLKVKYSWNIDYGWLYDDITIKNKSAFPLTNIKFFPTIQNKNGTYTPKNPEKALWLDYLPPGGSYKWGYCIEIPYGKVETDHKSDRLECNQGKAP